MSDLYTFVGPAPAFQSCYIDVELGGWLFDGVTSDDNNVVYSWQALDGWFDSADLEIGTAPRPVGLQQTVTKLSGRSITLTGLAHDPDPSTPLDDRSYAAIRAIKRNCRPVFGPLELIVNEPGVQLSALVRQTGPQRHVIIAESGRCIGVKFQIPLLAPDPRRYSTTTKSIPLSPGSNTVTNEGDEPTPVVIHCFGPATNPSFQNMDAVGDPTLAYTGSFGASDLMIDTDQQIVKVAGIPQRSNLTTAEWWQLVPGDNEIVVSDDCTIEYRDAYS